LVIWPTPDFNDFNDWRVSGILFPIELIIPIPVTTTLDGID